jgi:hypothetical protein
MTMTQFLVATFTSYLTQYFVVGMAWLVGAILSIVYWQRRPKVSRLTLIAIAIFLVESLVSTFLNLYIPFMSQDRGLTIGLVGWYFSLYNIVASLMQAAAWGFVLAAIFSKRDEA